MTRQAFEATWPVYTEACVRLSALFDYDSPSNVYYRAEMQAELDKLRLPKSKLRPRKDETPIVTTVRLLLKHVPEVHRAIKAAWDEAGGVDYARFKAAKEAADAVLKEAAEDAEVRSSDKPLLYYTASSSTWNSQGFGAMKYARGNAEAIAAEVAAHGVRTEVREVNRHRSGGQWSIDHADYEVHVYVESEMDMEILKRKPGLPLREWVRQCWARGVNPRVYNPYLPYGYEEKVGIDCQGRDLRRKEGPV